MRLILVVEKEELQNLEFLVTLMLKFAKLMISQLLQLLTTAWLMVYKKALVLRSALGRYFLVLYSCAWKRQPGFKFQLHLFLVV